MTRYYKVNHLFEVPDEVDIDAFIDALLKWVESNNWITGGSITEVDEAESELPVPSYFIVPEDIKE